MFTRLWNLTPTPTLTPTLTLALILTLLLPQRALSSPYTPGNLSPYVSSPYVSSLSPNALPSLTGTWQGHGTAFTHRRARSCEQVAFDLEDTEDLFHIHFGFYACEDLVAEYPPSTFIKTEGHLLFAGQIVGSYDAHSIELHLPEEFYHMQLRLKNHHLSFSEFWDDGQSHLKVQAQLYKNPIEQDSRQQKRQ